MSAGVDGEVVIIGGGLGGLAAAAYLNRMGARVTLVERGGEVGGKAAPLEREGFVFDGGPSLITMPGILEETFAAAGSPFSARAELQRLDPICAFKLFDDRDMVISEDPAATMASIASVSAGDASRWPRFLADCEALFRVAGEPYLRAPFDGVLGLFSRVLRTPSGLKEMKLAKGTLADFAEAHFDSEVMRAFVGHFAAYAGGSPRASSAAMALIPHVEIGLGAFYARGGVNALSRTLASALEAKGVCIERGVEVTQIDFEGRDATGVTLVRSRPGHERRTERLPADAVIANVDPLRVVSRLLPERLKAQAGLRALSSRTPSLSGFVWSFGIEGELPVDAVHTLLLGRDSEEEFRAIFERGIIADEPSVYVSVPTLIDPSRAPPGHNVVMTLLNAPATAATADWAAATPRLRRLVLARLERAFGANIERRIKVEVFVTPRDLAETGSPDGAIYGAAPHGAFAQFTKPRNRAEGLRGLYYVGGATHPGGGVTMVMKGGQFVAELIREDQQRGRLRRRPAP